MLVAGAGMAGLVAGAHAAERGAPATVFEMGSQPGGSMRLSSGFVWRYRDLDTFREQCPGGDPALQRLVLERLDNDLDWLESLGAPVLERETGNPLTVGRRFDVQGLTETLASRCDDLRLKEPLGRVPEDRPVVLATGGFQGELSMVREHITPEAENVPVRANRWSCGDGLRLGLAAGGSLSDGMDEFYGRCMPAQIELGEGDYVRLSQLYARHATVEDDSGERYEPRHWSETDVAQWVARRPRAEAWLIVEDDRLGERVRDRTVGEMIEAAREAGARVERRGTATAVRVVAAITQTLGGLRVDESARAAEGVFAAGADAGGISLGGWSSGLAVALVLGRVAADSAVAAAA